MKQYYTITNPATYDAAHVRAHYTFDGSHYMNAGEYIEVLCKTACGVSAKKDGSTPYNVGSDIEEYQASVKSSAATLVNWKLAETLEKSLDVYFKNTASKNFWYGSIENNVLIIYKMTAATFRKFLEKFSFINERGCVRVREETKMMKKWLNMNV